MKTWYDAHANSFLNMRNYEVKIMRNEETARRLRQALAYANLSQQELSDRSGVSKASVSQYINGTHSPGNKTAGMMADILNVNPLWLMGFDVEMEKPLTADKDTERIKTYYKLISKLDKAEQEEVFNYINFLLSKKK